MDLINTLKREFFLALVIGVLPQKYLGVLSKKLSTYQRTGRIHFIFPPRTFNELNLIRKRQELCKLYRFLR